MTVALVNICFDPRLDPSAVRYQLRQRLGDGSPPDTKVFVVSDAGGNIGSSARNLIQLITRQHDRIVFAAVLHHDDCLADIQRMRQPLDASAAALRAELDKAGFAIPVSTGRMITETSSIVWSDRPPRNLETLPFRMPRMYGR